MNMEELQDQIRKLAENFAKHYKFNEALRLVGQCKYSDKSKKAKVLDLQARILVQQGKYDEAIAKWKAALSFDPTGTSQSRKGIKIATKLKKIPILGGSPFIYYTAKKLALFIPIIVTCIGLWIQQFHLPSRKIATASYNKETGLRSGSNVLQNKTGLENTKPEQPKNWLKEKPKGVEVKTAHPKLPLYKLDIGDVKIEHNKQRVKVIFEDGLFLAGSNEIKKECVLPLNQVANAIKERLKDIRVIIVEGHTCDLPMRKGARWANNYVLSLARAESVVQYLIEQYQLPPSILLAVGAGHHNPPFPQQNKAENRTVVIKIILGDKEI